MAIGTKGLYARGIGISGAALRGLFARGDNFASSAAATIITTQPPASVDSGVAISPAIVAKATTDGVTVDTSFTGNAVATLSSGSGTLANATVACVAGVATFTGLTVTNTIGGGTYTLTITMAGYAPVVSNSFILVGSIQLAAMAATAALVAILDPADQTSAGRCKVVRDVRKVAYSAGAAGVNVVAGKVHRWNDYRTSASGGSDLQPGAGSDANGPTLTGTPGSGTEALHFDGTQWMETAATAAAYALNASSAVHIINIVRASANGGIGGIARDPTAATVPYLMTAAVSSKYAAVTKPTTTARTMDSAVATSGVTTRCLIASRYELLNGVLSMNATSSGDPTTAIKVGGRVAVQQIGIPFSAETYTSGNNYEVVGRQAGNFFTGDLLFQAIIVGNLSQAQVAAIEAFAVAQFGATLDNSKRTKINPGASITWGANNSGVQAADPFPVYSLGLSVSSRGSLTAQGFESNPGAVNWGVSGRTVAQLTYLFDTQIAPQIDTSRPGPNIVVIGDVMLNSLNSGGRTAVQVVADLQLLLAKVQAAGAYAVLWTVEDYSGFYTGSAYNPAVGMSAMGIQAQALNAALRADWTTYPAVVGLWDVEADPAFKIDKFGNGGVGVQSCANSTYYDPLNGGGAHLNNGGEQYFGVLEAAFFADKDYTLYPISTSRRFLRPRLGSRSAT